MSGGRIRKVGEVLDLIASGYEDIDEVAIECFNHKLCELQPPTSDRKELSEAIKRLPDLVSGGTRTYEAIHWLLQKIFQNESRRPSYVNLMIMTDAEDYFDESLLKKEWSDFLSAMEGNNDKLISSDSMRFPESMLYGSQVNEATTVLVGSSDVAESAQLGVIGNVLKCEDDDFADKLRRAIRTVREEVKYDLNWENGPAKPMKYFEGIMKVRTNEVVTEIKKEAREIEVEIKKSTAEVKAAKSRVERIAGDFKNFVDGMGDIDSMSVEEKRQKLQDTHVRVQAGKEEKLRAKQTMEKMEKQIKTLDAKFEKICNKARDDLNRSVSTETTAFHAITVGLRRTWKTIGSLFKRVMLFSKKKKKEIAPAMSEEGKRMQKMLYDSLPDMPDKFRLKFIKKIDKLIKHFEENSKEGKSKIKTVQDKLVQELKQVKEGKSNLAKLIAVLEETLTNLELKEEELEDAISDDENSEDDEY
eukprot:jgi/Bigna1/136335/aug1.33_g11043